MIEAARWPAVPPPGADAHELGQVKAKVATFTEHGHYPCHHSLVAALTDAAARRPEATSLDLVAVPAARVASNLRHAAFVAASTGAHLLVLCSRSAAADAAFRVATRQLPAERVTTVRVPPGWCLPGLNLVADSSPLTRSRDVDTHLKRNVALAVMRQVGWSRIMFLDDDVRGFGPAEAAVVGSVLSPEVCGGPQAVGWIMDDFPDNSMVCHAYRRAGGDQRSFIGGGALALVLDEDTPHFPRSYNEDWLFMLPYLLRGPSSLVLGGSLKQRSFDPFGSPRDAILQEAGDVLGEGLFRLVHCNLRVTEATSQTFWRQVLADRCALIVAVKNRLVAKGGEDVPAIIDALDAALTMDHKARDWPVLLARWVSDWLCDMIRWRHWAGRLGSADSLREGLRQLGLRPYVPEPGHGPDRIVPGIVPLAPSRA